jgi:phosphatidylglycerophosphatase A
MKRLAASCFGLGRLPIAPGTWGSLPPAVIFALLCDFGVSAVSISIVMASLVLAGSAVCVMCAPAVVSAAGEADPREVVADEFAGQALAFSVLLATPVGRKWIVIVAMLGFVLFRLFDIVKPWPIGKLEKLPGGWGVLADDLLAGVYTAVILNVCILFWFVIPAAEA